MNNCLGLKRLAAGLLGACTLLVMLPTAWGATLVVANKSDATASLLDLDSGEVVATLPTGDGPHEVGISPDGRFALVSNYGGRGSSNNSLTLIDVAKAEVVKTIDLGEFKAPHGVEWIDDERAAVTVEANKALAVVDVRSGEVTQAIATDQAVSHMVALDPGGKRAYTSNMGSGTITVLDLDAGERLKNVATGSGAEGIAVSTAGHVWVTNREADTLTVLDGESLQVLQEVSSIGFPIRATATTRGQVLVTRARAGDLAVYDAATFELVRTVAFDLESLGSDGRLFRDRFGKSSVPIGVVVDAAGDRAFVAHANADVITEVDLASGEVVRVLRAGREPDGMGYSSVDR
jgi:DNA-binding beta-propeller fold protein YncE